MYIKYDNKKINKPYKPYFELIDFYAGFRYFF